MNIRLILLLFCFVFTTSVATETVYKTRDAEGNIVFSDVPSEGAEKIEIQEAQTLNLPEPKRFGERPTTKLTPEGIKYTQFKITSPENESTIRSNEGIVNITMTLSPELDEEHTIVILIGGKKVDSGKSLNVSLSNIERGAHDIIAQVKDENNKTLKQSNKLTIYLHKASKLFNNRANAEASNPSPSPAPAAPVVPTP